MKEIIQIIFYVKNKYEPVMYWASRKKRLMLEALKHKTHIAFYL